MSHFKFHDLSKKTERLQKQISDSTPVWGDNKEEDNQQLNQVKKKWLRKQNKEFQKLKQEQSQNRNIKSVVSTLISVTLVAIAVPFVPKLWQISAESFAELMPESKEGESKDGFLGKLTDMQDKYKAKEKIEKLVKACEKDPLKTPADCQKIAETATVENENPVSDGNKKGGKSKIAEQMEESLDSIDQYNKDLKKAIEMSE